ncbi:MAG: hypothetical protein RL141_1123 [Candidatus Parcubacteria bacterium]|jgi:phosphoribosylformylglycinamidine cyclo-ligase
MTQANEYAQAGVDYSKIDGFKRLMQAVGQRTRTFSVHNGVWVEPCDHGVCFRVMQADRPHSFLSTTEGLGNKNYIAEWMAMHAGTGQSYYDGIGQDTVLMSVNDLAAHGAIPVLYTDEVAAGDSDWFATDCARDLSESFYRILEELHMTLGGGESPALKYLMNPRPPVKACPSLSGCATGVIYEGNPVRREPRPGDAIIGATSSGLHANGVSLVIERTLSLLKDGFLTRLPNGNMLGQEALIPTRSYVALVQALLKAQKEKGVPFIRGFLPGTGGGVAKLAADDRPLTYRITNWGCPIPPLFQFMNEGLGVSLEGCLKTFNWGIGYYVFVDPRAIENVIAIGKTVGYDLFHLGFVEDGPRKVVFEPAGITLPPPGD